MPKTINNKYWVEYWTTNPIVKKNNPQAKVGRSINGIPISDKDWTKTLEFITTHLKLNKKDYLLDVCAGSGMISIPFSRLVNKITALDISAELLANILHRKNIESINADAREISFTPESFSKIVFYFAIQHFTYEEVICLFDRFKIWLKNDGIVYIGDIPDIDRIFAFFNTKDRKEKYFESLRSNTPIIGTWFKKEVLLEMTKYCGFKKCEIIDQPKSFINSRYRFDIKLLK